MSKRAIAGLLLLLLVGCSNRGQVLETAADDPDRVTKRMVAKGSRENVVSHGVLTRVRYRTRDRTPFPSHSDRVCMLPGSLPPEVKYQEVGRISAQKLTYGSIDQVLPAMADEGRRIGVEAIIGLQTSHKAGAMPWRFSSPVGSGVLVKIEPESLPFDCAKAEGQLF